MKAPWIAVVGAGPAGLAAACEAYRHGCGVTLVDEASRPGGQIYRQPSPGLGVPRVALAGEERRKEDLLSAFQAASEGIEYCPRTTAYAVFPGPELHIATEERGRILRPAAVVLATGVSERGVPFPGWTLPGVLYAGGVQATLKGQGVRAGDGVAVVGAGPLPLAVAAQLIAAGAEVRCVALLHPLRRMARDPRALWAGRDIVREGLAYLRTVRRAKVPLLQGWVPLRAEGDERVESLWLARHDGSGRPVAGHERRVAVDLVAFNYGFTTNSELARMAGAEVTFDLARGGWIPAADEYGATAAPGVFLAGDVAGLRGAPLAAAEGRIVGAAAAAHARGNARDGVRAELGSAFSERARHLAFQAAVRRSLMLPPGVWDWAEADTVVCRCEGVTCARLERAIADGHHSLDAIKRNTRAGMGWCGGRTCSQAVGALLHGGQPPASAPPLRSRPPARPVPLGAVARSKP
ncbi:MAG: FAD-dependent oxidoreductase [Gammaproteobacteria bacterium]|nr:FAD-dependent oxidoreductase [Gammaproteobacteria bacterium]NIR83814.1 FAD-dependent oxidoreductase [Gammaproteobacteria bacterium]NIR88231.1 FAD-dependent oxidoreductase [Gammaproteobacteria bacterium]NIU05140.1 FAD-dependent oxidoreductase [Gammaproteobacteria bacterium]NIV51977.1 FAD-dependent oxidoreductase [Gammaproteobacteria bacterium]